MITITAITQTKTGHARTLQAALPDVTVYVQAAGLDTMSFRPAPDTEDDHIFAKNDRFTSTIRQIYNDRYLSTDGLFEVAEPIIERPVISHSCGGFSQRARP
ncbi:MAG: hypothetical protein AAF665_14625 [Pseudomonadota bacterium]